MITRPLRPEDRPAWDDLWAGYLAFYRASVTAEVSDATFARLTDPGYEAMVGLAVAESEDAAPLGFAHLVFHPGTWSQADSCYLEDLFVSPASRGGVASNALFDAIYVYAGERGAGSVYWHTQAYNGRARSLYDEVGSLTSFVHYVHELD